MHTHLKSVRAAAAAALVGLVAASSAFAQDAPVGDWEGSIEAQGTEIPVVFHITMGDDDALGGTLDSPAQGVFGLVIANNVTFADGALSFDVPDVAGSYEGELGEDGKTLVGSWSQGGMNVPLEMTLTEG